MKAAPQYDYGCDACHHMPPLDSDTGSREPSTGAVKGNHMSHSGASAATCVKCHGSELTSTGHRDKTIQVTGNLNNSPKGAFYSRTFFNQTTIPPVPLGKCSNTNCHFEATSPDWGTKPSYAVPADCNQCHLMIMASGSHPRHATYYGSGTDSCANCHPNHATEPLPFRHATSAANRGIAISFASGGAYSGDGKNFLPSQNKTSFGSCTATYCHSNGAGQPPNTPAVWGGNLPIDCTGCHGGNAANPATAIATGSHGKHINNANFTSGVNLGTNYSCARCHNGTVDVGSDTIVTNKANHVDGTKQVTFTDGGSYGSGSCSTTMCHSAGKAAAPQPAAPQWGGAALDCKGCHGAGGSYGEPVYPNAGPGQELANSHSAKHFSNPAMCVNCHATTTADGVSIINGSTAHADGAITVRFPAKYDLGGASYDGTVGAKSCSSTYCHSDGNGGKALETTQWGGKTTCRSCHGGDAASSAPIATYAHAAHINSETTLGRGNNLMCAECHAKTVGFDNNTTVTNAASHLNVYKDYSGVRAGGKANYDSDKVCSNVYCHSSGEATPVFRNMTGSKKWDGGAKLGCDGCHGYGVDDFKAVAGEPNYKSRAGAPNSHQKHTVGANMADSRGCAICHRTTVDQGVKNKLKNYSSTHLNGVREVNFAVLGNYTGSYDRTSKTCSNTYCHGVTSQANWGGASLSCSSCHKSDGTLAGKHGAHWQGGSAATNYTATPGNLTGTATSYNFECSSCHNGTHATGPATNGNGNAAEVFFNYTAKGLKGNYSYGTATAVDGTLRWSNGSCTTTYCHSDGNGAEGFSTGTMTWAADQTLGCNGCHGGTYPGTNPIATGLHKNHLDTDTNSSLGKGNGLKCAACHALTVGTGSDTLLTDKRRHVNKFKDYSGALAGGSSSYDQTTKRCSNIYCHSNGKRGTNVYEPADPAAWTAQQATLGCNGCHGNASSPDFTSDAMGTPNYAGGQPGTNTSNSHKLHIQKMGIATSNACYVCHARTVDKYADKTFRPYSTTHLSDGTTHVTFGAYSTTGFKLMNPTVARYSNKTCSSVTCHSNGKGGYQDVKWGAKSDCAMCHPLNRLSRGHSFHVYTSATNNPTFYDNYTANRSTGLRYNYGCGICHPLNNPNHMKGTVLIDMSKGYANVVGTLRSRNAITVGGVVAGTTGSGTTLSGGDVVCSNVYCHSNGYSGGTGLVYATTPGWNTGVFSTSDRCAACHGNAPNSGTIPGSPSHYNKNWVGGGADGGHVIGVHSGNITNGVNFTGLLTPGTTDPSSHGATPTTTPTTISCNTCHYGVVITSANSGSAQCISCHGTNGSATTKALAVIANKALHVNGSVSVQFITNTPLISKAQLKDASFALFSSTYMKRYNGYKASTSYDASKINLDQGSYAGNGGNCTTVCHFNKPVRWDNSPAATTCSSCHSTL